MVILSGKGGTGKTTVAAALAHLASRSHSIILADADVDAANLGLLLAPRRTETHEFVSGEVAVLHADACTGCGKCLAACRFEAVTAEPRQRRPPAYRVDEGNCEGCAACFYVCPAEAITMRPRHCGQWYASETRFGPLLHAHLFAGQENSGLLVTRLRQEALARAAADGVDLIIVDGPPGIGCPVIASVSGVDLALLVTEPSVSGIHDLERIRQTAAHFGIACAVVVNKADLNAARREEISAYCQREGLPLLGTIPYDLRAIHTMVQGHPVTENSGGPLAEAMRTLWTRVAELLALTG